jgi:hypothetical protein
VKTLRDEMAMAICLAGCGIAAHRSDYFGEADAAILALRQWLADEGLVVVPKSRSDWLHEAVKDASLRAAKNGSVAPELMCAPILWAMQDALAAAPDALRAQGE